MKIIICFSVFVFFFSALQGQQPLTPEEAVSISLKNNYDILVSRNDANIDSVNNTLGNAGMLPYLSATGTDNYSPSNNITQKPSTGPQVTSANTQSNSLTAGVNLNWTLFDGGKMFVTKNKLSEIEALGEIDFRDRVLQTTYNVVLAYYNIVKQKQQQSSIKQVISYNQDRVNILQTSFNAGATAKNNLLQAKIDFNVSTENSLTQENVINTAKRNLNQLLCRNIDSTAYDVIDSIPLTFKPNKEELLKIVQTNNTNILAYQKLTAIAALTIKESQSLRLPKVNFNAGYNYANSNYNYGTTVSNRTLGPQLGGSITIPLFQGGNINRQISNSKIQFKSAEYQLENAKLQVQTQFQNALTDFENQQKLLDIEQQNSEMVKENLEISLLRLKLGQTTALEVKLAQQSYEDSFTRLINFKYNLKIAETKLKQLIAGL